MPPFRFPLRSLFKRRSYGSKRTTTARRAYRTKARSYGRRRYRSSRYARRGHSRKHSRSIKTLGTGSNAPVLRMANGCFPSRALATHPYVQTQRNGNLTVGNITYETYQINSPWDPTLNAVTGQQPVRGFIELSDHYVKNRTYRTHYTVDMGLPTWTSDPTNAADMLNGPIYVFAIVSQYNNLSNLNFGAHSTSTAIGFPDWDKFAQMPGCHYKMLGGVNQVNKARFKGYVNMWEAYGLSKIEFMGNSNFDGGVTDGPINGVYLHIGFFNGSPADCGATMFNVSLHMKTEWYNPIMDPDGVVSKDSLMNNDQDLKTDDEPEDFLDIDDDYSDVKALQQLRLQDQRTALVPPPSSPVASGNRLVRSGLSKPHQDARQR